MSIVMLIWLWPSNSCTTLGWTPMLKSMVAELCYQMRVVFPCGWRCAKQPRGPAMPISQSQSGLPYTLLQSEQSEYEIPAWRHAHPRQYGSLDVMYDASANIS